MGRLNGKTALITGGSSGIGLECARLFVAEGARVLLTGRDRAALEAAAQELGPCGAVFRSDAGSVAEIGRLFEQVAERVDGLDVLFVNAGVARATPLGQTTEATFDEILAINVKGAFFAVQAALPLLRPGSSVILNASAAAYNGAAAAAGYAASKAAVRSLARNFSADLAGRNIRINVLSPGPVATPIWERTGASAELRAAAQRRLELSIPAGRLGTPQEVARAALFLASGDSSFMVGAELVVDGGVTQLPAGAPAYR
jgi:NAD(P)-dependent dehydrogenase (short-subunit alcohol dehydrogenase family)